MDAPAGDVGADASLLLDAQQPRSTDPPAATPTDAARAAGMPLESPRTCSPARATPYEAAPTFALSLDRALEGARAPPALFTRRASGSSSSSCCPERRVFDADRTETGRYGAAAVCVDSAPKSLWLGLQLRGLGATQRRQILLIGLVSALGSMTTFVGMYVEGDALVHCHDGTVHLPPPSLSFAFLSWGFLHTATRAALTGAGG